MTKKHETEKQAHVKAQDQPSAVALRHASERSPTEYSGIDTSDKYDKAAATLKGAPEPDYYQINYLERGAVEAPWQSHVALFPTREEADAKAESLKAGGASAVYISPRFWGYRYWD